MPLSATVPADYSTMVETKRSWLADRILPLVLLALALPLALLTAWNTLAWLPPGGRLFPGFFVMENGVVPTVGLFHWTGMTHHMPFAARIVAVDGHPVRTNADVYRYVATLPEGTVVEYAIVRDGAPATRRIPTMRFGPFDYALTVGLFVLNGFIGLFAGFVVALLRPRLAATRGFLFYGFFWGLFPLTGTALYDPPLAWLSRFHWTMAGFFPATFIHLGLVFPVERGVVRRRRTLLLVPYLVSALLMVWMFAAYFTDPPSWRPVKAIFLYSAVSMLIFVALLSYSYWENRNPRVRPSLQIVIPGFVLAALTAIYGFFMTGVEDDFPINLIAVTPIVFFASIAYAITAHDAFDINRMLRRTALYFALTLVVSATYASVVAVGSFLLPVQRLVASVGFQIAVFVAFGFLFEPVRRRLQHLIDVTFDRERVDYRRAVDELSAALTSVLDLDEIVERVGGSVSRGFALETFAAVVWGPERTAVWHYDVANGGATEAPSAHGFPLLRNTLRSRQAAPVLLADDESGTPLDGALAAELGEPSPRLAIPLVVGDTLLGAFLLGAKRSGLPFSRDDFELLRTLGAQSAIAVQNAISYRALLELAASLEDRVRRRTRELETSNGELARKHDEVERSRAELAAAYDQLRSTQRQLLQSEKLASLGQLVAGVAHEINNPVSFILSNLRPLTKRLETIAGVADRLGDEALGREVARMRQIVEDIGSGADRTAGIVRDLRTFSRINDAPRVTCDVHESLEVALRLLKPKWHDRVDIAKSYGDLPPIRAVPGQLNQVFMNLLANAFDAIDGRGTVEIRTWVDGDHARVAIRDDGAGIPADDLDRIFDPFFTTKPQGQGTGLGLSISHGIIEDHGGRIEVQGQAGSGTTFTVVLPLSEPATRARDAGELARSATSR